MTTTQSDATRRGATVEAGGVPTYYESTGHGEPLVLLHGGLATAETFDFQVPTLASRYRVLVPERYGHGRTPDVPGFITYEAMAQQTIDFIDAVVGESTHVAGWSDGALVALLVALRRPQLVRKLVLIDQFVTLPGAAGGYLDYMSQLTVDTLPAELRDLYAAVSPDGAAHFPVVFEKLHRLWTGATGVDVDDLAYVHAPTLVLCGDDGTVSLTHVAAVMAALPDAQLAVVPGTSHGLVMEKPHVVNQLILDFLAPEQVPKIFPLSH